MAPQPEEEHHEKKARYILDGMSRYRLDPASIKMTDTTPRTRGGQAVVLFGTLTRPGSPRILIPEPFEKLLPKIFEKSFCDNSNELSPGALAALSEGSDVITSVALRMLSSGSLRNMTGQGKEAVFEAAKELLLGKNVAVKSLEWQRDDAEESAGFFKSFVNEISLMTSLSHPHIIEFLGFVEDMKKGDAWIILPWEANGNVREFLKSGDWDIPERISLIQDTAKGLEYLHCHDPPICHGDLKSLNILVNSSCRAVITDFGSARIKRRVGLEKEDTRSEPPRPELGNDDLAPESTSPQVKFDPETLDLTLTGPKFSLRWTAPEVLKDEMQDLPGDMWAMGWICWEIMTDEFPFEGLRCVEEIVVHTIKGKLPPIRKNNQLSNVLILCSLMSDCWLSDPNKRVGAFMFQQKVVKLPSETPSGPASGGEKTRSAGLLVELGRIYELQSDREKAKTHYLSAIDIATRTKDDLARANALHCLGRIQGATSDFGEAESSYRQALDICSRGGNELGTANALGGLGEIYRMQSRHGEAEQAFNNARETHSRIGNDLGTGNALFGLGNTYKAQSRNREAEKAFDDARETHSRIGNDLGTANALLGLGNTYLGQSMNQKAEKSFLEAQEIHSRIGNDLGAASAFDGLGQVYHAQSQHREAEMAFNQACEIHSRLKNHLGMGNALVGLGEIHLAQSRTGEAEKAFTEAHEIHSRIGNDIGVANALDGLGELYLLQSKNQQAQKAFDDARKTHSRIGNDLGTGNALLGLGNTYLAQSMNLEAERAFMEAHEIHSRIGNEMGVASALDGLGQVHLRDHGAVNALNDARATHPLIGESHSAKSRSPHLGILDSDQRTYTDAEPRCGEVSGSQDRDNDGHSSDRTPWVLGKLHQAQHRYLETEEAVTKALAVATDIAHQQGHAATSQFFNHVLTTQSKRREDMDALIQAEAEYGRIGDYAGCGRTWCLIGRVQVAQGMYAEAEESYQRSQAIFLSINDTAGVAIAVLQCGRACIYQGRYAEAEEHLIQARLLYAKISHEKGEVNALNLLAAAYGLQGKFGDAKAVFREACEIYTREGQPVPKHWTYTWDILQVAENNPI